jgi:hypothetical protein
MSKADRKANIRERMASTGKSFMAAARALDDDKALRPYRIRERGHRLIVVPAILQDEFPWYAADDGEPVIYGPKCSAILEFSGFWKGIGPKWRLHMDPEIYDDDVYETGGQLKCPPLDAVFNHLDRVRVVGK